MKIILKETGGIIYNGAIININDFLNSFHPVDVSESGTVVKFNAPTIDEISLEYEIEEVKKEAKRLLNESDWIIIKSSELCIPVSDEWKAYRNSLRSLLDYAGDELNWPKLPLNN